MPLDIDNGIDGVEPDAAKRALKKLLKAFLDPAFGALPKRELDLTAFDVLRDLDLLGTNPSLYQLMADLKITKAKARNLLFDLDVRAMGNDADALDNAVRSHLEKAKFTKDGAYFVIEIENPLTLAHLAEKVRRKGYVTDGSFNASIARVPLDALCEVMADLLSPEAQESVRRALEAAGAPPAATLENVLKGAVKSLAKRAVGEAADVTVEMAGDFLKPILAGAAARVEEAWSTIFGS